MNKSLGDVLSDAILRGFSSGGKMDKYHHSQRLLDELEVVLRQHCHWQLTPPDPQALASTEPFAIDTLDCHQWLQWIFIPKFGQLIALRLPLPERFEISPYVEEAMKEQAGVEAILAITHQLDLLFKQH